MINNNRSEDETVEALRETDRWLRSIAVYIPILAFAVGWGTGVITTFYMFRDHERRITVLESGVIANSDIIRGIIEKQNRVIGKLGIQ